MARPPWSTGLAGGPPNRSIDDVLNSLQYVARQVFTAQETVQNAIHGLTQKVAAIPQASTTDIVAAVVKALEPYFSYVDQEIKAMSDTLQAGLDNLKAQVTALTTAEQSAVALMNGIPQLIADAVAHAQAAGATPEQLQSLTDLATTIQSDASGLAAAVTANTPAAPAAPAEPVPPAA